MSHPGYHPFGGYLAKLQYFGAVAGVFTRWHPAHGSVKTVGEGGLVVRRIDPNSCSACRAERFDDKQKKLSSDPFASMSFVDRETYDLSRYRVPRTVPHHA